VPDQELRAFTECELCTVTVMHAVGLGCQTRQCAADGPDKCDAVLPYRLQGTRCSAFYGVLLLLASPPKPILCIICLLLRFLGSSRPLAVRYTSEPLLSKGCTILCRLWTRTWRPWTPIES